MRNLRAAERARFGFGAIARTPETIVVSLTPTDHDVIRWATTHGLRWYYADDIGPPPRALKVHCGCVTAYFRRGRLAHLRADADSELLDAMFEELAGLMPWTWQRPAREVRVAPATRRGSRGSPDYLDPSAP